VRPLLFRKGFVMSAIAGSVKECSIRGRGFKPASDDDVKITLGGYSNDTSPNGDTTVVMVKTSEAAGVEGLNVMIDHDKGDLEFLQEIADGKDFVDFSITLADDSTFQGKCIPKDLPALSTKAARCELKLGFNGKITRQ
jgi:hypothetical protein